MSTTQQAIENDATSVLSSDDDFLSELENELNASEDTGPDLESDVDTGADEVVAADLDADLEAELDAELEQVLADSDSGEADAEPEAKQAEPEKKPAKKSSKKKTDANPEDAEASAGEPKKRLSLGGMLPSEALEKAFGDKRYEYCVTTKEQAGMDESTRKAAIDAYLTDQLDTLAKKVREKVINAFQYIGGSATLSVYTVTALNLLKEKGEFTLPELKNVYLDHPYSPGTASAQGSQMMKLLPALNVAQREGNKLVLIEDAPLLELLGQ